MKPPASESEPKKAPNKKNPDECPECGSKMLARRGGCTTCLECGWSSCAIA
jgi:hypothetical protein